MIVTFCGHGDFRETEEERRKMFGVLEKIAKQGKVDFYLGGYGNFDGFAYECCKQFKRVNPNVKLVLVVPYFTEKYQKNCLNALKKYYDEIVYPQLENRLPRLAILYRNYYMAEKADYVVAYVNRDWGGAYKTFEYAKKSNKKILNLAETAEGNFD